MAYNLEKVTQGWSEREGLAILATVDGTNKPNAIYVGEIWWDAEIGFVVADNYFCKTRENIKNGTMGAILFITKDRKSFQVKGPMTYHTEGPIFETMRSRHNDKHPGVAAVLLQVEEAYSGAEKLYAKV